jgi:hypothetical protein
VNVTNAQSWTLLGIVGVLMSVIGAMIINRFHLLRVHLDARFDSVDRQLAYLDRDVQALFNRD